MHKLLFGAILLGCLWAYGGQVEQRRAFRELLDKKDTATVRKHLSDRDPQIRMAALNYVCEQDAANAVGPLKKALQDEYSPIRLMALKRLSRMSDPAIPGLIEKMAQNDPDNAIRQMAAGLSWPFKRENRLLRDDPSWDYEVVSVKSFAIPEENWKFSTDPKAEGHRKDFYQDNFNDRTWKPIKIGHWEGQGWTDYDGYAWYRIRFKMPDKIESNAVEVHFEAVDESAWVWMNGIYLGKHDIGIAGWDKPFRLDMTKEIKWGQENILTVRVLDRADGGGIWKPINVDILK